MTVAEILWPWGAKWRPAPVNKELPLCPLTIIWKWCYIDDQSQDGWQTFCRYDDGSWPYRHWRVTEYPLYSSAELFWTYPSRHTQVCVSAVQLIMKINPTLCQANTSLEIMTFYSWLLKILFHLIIQNEFRLSLKVPIVINSSNHIQKSKVSSDHALLWKKKVTCF